jgi:hypothetical protein
MGNSTVIVPAPPPASQSRRVLAGLAFAGVIAVFFLMPFVLWRRHTPVALLHGLVVLPGSLWAGHFSWHTARGTAPRSPYWPFATKHVASAYWIISVVISLFASRLYR